MSGFPDYEPDDEQVQLIIVHMDDSESHISFSTDCDETGWRIEPLDGLVVGRHGGRTTFPWCNVKSYTVVFADETLAEIRHLDPDHVDTPKGQEPK